MALVSVLCLGLSQAAATTFYVDFDNGFDNNSGLSRQAAWKNLPGTSGGGSQSVSSGDVIMVKPGGRCTTGSVNISSSRYGSPVTIQADTGWSGAQGDIVFDGININVSLSGVTMAGASWARFTIINLTSGKDGLRCVPADNSSFSWFVIGRSNAHVDGWGLQASFTDNTTFADFDIGYTGFENRDTSGVAVGGWNDDRCTNLTFTRVNVHHTGGGVKASAPRRDGWNIVGASDIKLISCNTYENGRRGVDMGTVTNTNDCTVTLIDCRAWNNGSYSSDVAANYALSGGSGGNQVLYAINTISMNSNQGFLTYAGAKGYYYHCISDGNKYAWGGSDGRETIVIKNSISYGSGRAFIKTYESSSLATIVSDNNLWNESASIYLFVADGGGRPSGWASSYTFSQIAAWQSQTGNDTIHKAGISANPAWIDRASGNYQIASSNSDAINAGERLTSPSEVVYDANGFARDSQPDIGAYEYGGTVVVAAPTLYVVQ